MKTWLTCSPERHEVAVEVDQSAPGRPHILHEPQQCASHPANETKDEKLEDSSKIDKNNKELLTGSKTGTAML